MNVQIVAKMYFINIKFGKLRSKLLASITNVRNPPPPLLRKRVPTQYSTSLSQLVGRVH